MLGGCSLAALWLAVHPGYAYPDRSRQEPEEQIPLSTSGAPEVVRPTNWNERLALAEREWKGSIIFPAAMLEHTASDAVLATWVWSLILSRRVAVGGAPYLVATIGRGKDRCDSCYTSAARPCAVSFSDVML